MSKNLTEAKITTREQRKKLVAGVHWRGIDPDVHLGYRKGLRGGKWLVRWYRGAAQGYQQQTFATADDELGEGTLDYNAAVKAARRFVETERRNARAAADGPLLTVRDAAEAYAAMRDVRDSTRAGREKRSDARSRLERYVIGHPARGRRREVPAAQIADVALCELSETDLLKWREALPESLKSATKRRLINDLKAALNAGYSGNRSKLPTTLPATIKHGLSANDVDPFDADPVARENQILTDAQVSGLISAARAIDEQQGWDGDLFRLVVVLAATGARFSQVSRLRVRDVQRDAARLIVPDSRKGRGGNKGSTPIPVGADVLKALLPAVTGRANEAPLLERWHNVQVAGGIAWQRNGRGAWKSASEMTRPWAAIRERAGMPEVIPYALRHSSIVRGIKQLPIRLVAALHDTSVAMIERHYGRWIADGLDELAARAVVPLVQPLGEDNVLQFGKA